MERSRGTVEPVAVLLDDADKGAIAPAFDLGNLHAAAGNTLRDRLDAQPAGDASEIRALAFGVNLKRAALPFAKRVQPVVRAKGQAVER